MVDARAARTEQVEGADATIRICGSDGSGKRICLFDELVAIGWERHTGTPCASVCLKFAAESQTNRRSSKVVAVSSPCARERHSINRSQLSQPHTETSQPRCGRIHGHRTRIPLASNIPFGSACAEWQHQQRKPATAATDVDMVIVPSPADSLRPRLLSASTSPMVSRF